MILYLLFRCLLRIPSKRTSKYNRLADLARLADTYCTFTLGSNSDSTFPPRIFTIEAVLIFNLDGVLVGLLRRLPSAHSICQSRIRLTVELSLGFVIACLYLADIVLTEILLRYLALRRKVHVCISALPLAYKSAAKNMSLRIVNFIECPSSYYCCRRPHMQPLNFFFVLHIVFIIYF